MQCEGALHQNESEDVSKSLFLELDTRIGRHHTTSSQWFYQRDT